ncbi:unnamed protein product, partial [Staurois parvus]
VRQTRSATCGQRGTKGAGREWSGSQAGFSNSRAAWYRGSGREWSGSQAGFSNSRAARYRVKQEIVSNNAEVSNRR